jgi:hypothetical protein
MRLGDTELSLSVLTRLNRRIMHNSGTTYEQPQRPVSPYGTTFSSDMPRISPTGSPGMGTDLERRSHADQVKKSQIGGDQKTFENAGKDEDLHLL